MTQDLQQHTADNWLEEFSQWAVELKKRPLTAQAKTSSENTLLLKNCVALTPKTTSEQRLSRLSTLESKYPALEINLEEP